MAYYDKYTVDELKIEIERLNKDLNLLGKEYENIVFKVASHLINKDNLGVLRYILETEYFSKQDVIDLFLDGTYNK